MSPNKAQTTIETSVEGARDAIVKAGFRPGRRVRIQVEYADAKEAREAGYKRLQTILDATPPDPQFAGMTEDEVMAYAISVVDEVREEHRKAGQ